MQFKYKIKFSSYFYILFSKVKFVPVFFPIVVSCFAMEFMEGKSYFIDYMALYFVNFFYCSIVYLILGILFSALCMIRYRKGGKVICVLADENGITETGGNMTICIKWSEVKRIKYTKKYISIKGPSTSLYTLKKDIGNDTFDKYKQYIKQEDLLCRN